MATLQAYCLLLWGRFKCRWIGTHDWRLRTSHGYHVAVCQRCWGYTLDWAA